MCVMMRQAVAPQHPERDASNSLLNNFNFRVFLFQDMEDGDSILISAKVIACVEAIDCAPVSSMKLAALCDPSDWSASINPICKCRLIV